SMQDQVPASTGSVPIPEEPPVSDPDAVTLQLRLPNNERILRRFRKNDRIAALRSLLQEQVQSGQSFECIVAGRRLDIDDNQRTFAESGIKTNTSVIVRAL